MRGAVLGLSLLSVVVGSFPAEAARAAKSPVVVELYTAQGCDGCAEANRLVGALGEKGGVLPLTFSVDYWDYLGWKDTFAAPEFAERQRLYVERLKVRDIYTPEVVVDGRAEAPGVDGARLEALIHKAQSERATAARPPRMALGRRAAKLGAGEGSGELWLVRFDRKPQSVRVRGDDHKTRMVTAFNVVRQLVRLGAWRGRARTYPLPASGADGLSSVVLLQGRRGGAILGVATE